LKTNWDGLGHGENKREESKSLYENDSGENDAKILDHE
jgi:hypothetical protein